MLFNSLIFVIFAVVFYALWFPLKRFLQMKYIYITAASFIFYGWWDWRFLFLIVFSGLVDYFAALGMERWRAKRGIFLSLSILANIGTLAIFKYSSFFLQNVNELLTFVGISYRAELSLPSFFLILPVGISFYTFQSMSYTIDVYRGQLTATRNLFHFFAYLSMFPQLVAGPIVRAKDILGQLTENYRLSKDDLFTASRHIIYGFFKKVVIADNLAPIVNQAFAGEVVHQSSMFWWATMIAFALQIYADFSGYSDIAIGLARLMGLKFKKNFNHPYIALSLKEFWERWHISLSSWFRDYVYIPLGGSKCSAFRRDMNIFLTMVISGLWHGASWNFVIWGGIHGACLIFEKNVITPLLGTRFKLARYLLVMVQVLCAWVFFRAESVTQALEIIKVMFSGIGSLSTKLGTNGEIILGLVLLRNLYVYFIRDRWSGSVKYQYIYDFAFPVLILLIIFFRGPGSEFIYFQF